MIKNYKQKVNTPLSSFLEEVLYKSSNVKHGKAMNSAIITAGQGLHYTACR